MLMLQSKTSRIGLNFLLVFSLLIPTSKAQDMVESFRWLEAKLNVSCQGQFCYNSGRISNTQIHVGGISFDVVADRNWFFLNWKNLSDIQVAGRQLTLSGSFEVADYESGSNKRVINRLSISAPDEATAKKMEKAFRYLTPLCGGKLVDNDLFKE